MNSSCFSCIPALYNQPSSSSVAATTKLRSRRLLMQPWGIQNYLLVDDILVEILSRLPAKYVAKYRMVCKRWKDLTSTTYFVQLHLKHIVPSIISPNQINTWDLLHTVEEWPWGETRRRRRGEERFKTVIGKSIPFTRTSDYTNEFYLSSHGLIVFLVHYFPLFFGSVLKCFIIFNPTTKEKVKVVTFGGKIYGIFFHPLLNEPCVLWGRFQDGCMQYKLLNLGLNSSWKTLRSSPVSSHEPRLRTYSADNTDMIRVGAVASVIVDDVLYWMVEYLHAVEDEASPRSSFISCSPVPCKESIMAFNIKKEEFYLMPHPEVCPNYEDKLCKDFPGRHSRMFLLAMDGFLSLIEHTFKTDPLMINIWILKDYANNRVWMKRHAMVNIDIFVPHHPVNWTEPVAVHFIAAVDGELLFRRASRTGLFAYNLNLGRVKKFEGIRKSDFLLSFAYTSSLVSLRNCESEIWMF